MNAQKCDWCNGTGFKGTLQRGECDGDDGLASVNQQVDSALAAASERIAELEKELDSRLCLRSSPDAMLKAADLILAALPCCSPDGPCPHCDLEVGFVCPECGLREGARELAHGVKQALARQTPGGDTK